MAQTIEGVERERGGKEGLFNDLDPVRQGGSKLDDICTAKGGRSNEIGKGETVEH
jgi:hypothetical protein